MSVNRKTDAEQPEDALAGFWPFKPEPGTIADQLIKKGEEIGEARGEARGTIRTLQQLLGLPEISENEFSELDALARESMIADLTSQLRAKCQKMRADGRQ